MIQTILNKLDKRIRFLLVGGVNTLADFICYSLLNLFIENIAVVGVLSGTAALFFAYITHSFITFRRTGLSRLTLQKFFLFTGFGMWVIRPILLTAFTLYPASAWDKASQYIPFSQVSIQNTLAFFAMVTILLIYNYLVYSRYVFIDHKDHKNHSAF